MVKSTLNLLGIICLLLSAVQVGHTQVMASFENFGLKPGQHLNNAAPGNGFKSGSIELPNFYDAQFDFWSGWAISADTNTTMPGFLNQYSAIPGSGALKTNTYGVGYIYDPIVVRLQPNAIGKPMIGMYVTNSTYTYLSMRDGDGFAKKFGGETGADPDFLLLTIKKYSGGAIDDDSINFYLADYRFPQAGKDYIVDEWTYIDLTTLGQVDSLLLTMRSSDVGIFGMNTPAYICIDQVSTDNLLSAASLDQQQLPVTLGPNPASDQFYIHLTTSGRVDFSNMLGQPQWSSKLSEGHHEVSVTDWPRGMYIMTFNGQFAAKVCLD
jgi:hypothetical protein